MTQFIFQLMYLIKDKVNDTDISQQPFNITTLPEKINELIKDQTSQQQTSKLERLLNTATEDKHSYNDIDQLVESTLWWSA
jgi:hypothetical protein